MQLQISAIVDANIPEIKAIGDFDTVAVILHFPSGTVGMIDLSRNSNYGYDQRLEVFGPRGVVQANNEQPNAIQRQYGLQGSVTAPIWYSFASRFMNGYRREFDHFIDIVHGKVKSLVTSKEILAVSKIATACEESARTGKIVSLNWWTANCPVINKTSTTQETNWNIYFVSNVKLNMRHWTRLLINILLINLSKTDII